MSRLRVLVSSTVLHVCRRNRVGFPHLPSSLQAKKNAISLVEAGRNLEDFSNRPQKIRLEESTTSPTGVTIAHHGVYYDENMTTMIVSAIVWRPKKLIEWH